MGKCVSRQSAPLHELASPDAQHHQSVLTIALSHEDLAQAHKIWQRLTGSNEYIAAGPTSQQEEEPFYYTISRQRQPEQQQQREQELEQAVLHIESLYNDAAIAPAEPATSASEPEYSTCQEFLLHELLQVIEEHAATTSATNHILNQSRIRPEPQLPVENNGWLALGQAESKKQGSKSGRRQHNGNGNSNGNPTEAMEQNQTVHTKGTAMSFGFRKKLNGTPKKFKKLLEGGDKSATRTDTKDDNGNAAVPIHFEKVGAAAVQKAGTLATGAAGGRFGYRGAVPRPSSAGFTAPSEDSESESMANAQNNINNNNNNNNGRGAENGPVLVSNLKRRSKSAHAGRSGDGEPKIAQPKTLTFNLNQNTTIEYQRRQFFGEIADETSGSGSGSGTGSRAVQPRYNYNNLASMHANVIVRPTPRPTPASYAKFTLQTVSLPRPEYPVAISLTATTPTTPSSSVQSPVPAHSTGARAKDISTSSRQHPLTSVHVQPQSRHLDQKSVKQLTNNSTRRGFSGSREISADSGIASMDMALDSSSGSSVGSKRSRSRPRNLKMVMSGRHTFEVRDADDPPSSESNSFVEPLALPKLPTDGSQSIPLPLLGLVRSNTVLSRESYERRQAETPGSQDQQESEKPKTSGSDESESVDEEKLYLDSSTSEKSAKHQSQSSVASTWRHQAGESLAAQDCSSMSMSISSDTHAHENPRDNDKEEDMSLGLDEISLINTDMQFSTISSMTETPPKVGQESLLNLHLVDNREAGTSRPRSFNNALNESKFAELALASSSCLLLDDETSPTDSLVSSTEDSEEAGGKLQKHKLNEERQQKDIDDIDIDDISPVLELDLDPPGGRSPISPGTPTHASHSLSLGSDCGNLIDDEIADQPALLCNSEAHEVATDTPTLMETLTHTQTGSLRSLKSQSKARTALQQAIELSLRTPAAVRKAVMDRAESLDTLSPCESICSDDLMMDFDMNSSVDSIDHMANSTGRSRSGSDLHKIGGQEIDPMQAETEAELLSELERRGSDVMKELNTLLRGRRQRGGPRERISAQLPARATRLLNRSRLQDQQLAGNDSDNSLRSSHSGGASAAARKRSTANSRTSSGSTASLPRQRHLQQQHLGLGGGAGGGGGGGGATASGTSTQRCGGELHSSSDDLMLYDKSFRNAMIQDVLQFKKQLLRLRRILQETETLNPFENDNVQLFAACGLDSKQLNDIDLASLTSSTTEDPLQELSDLRRQVVYLQGQVDDRDRTIRLQRDLIEQLEAEKRQKASHGPGSGGDQAKELISMATQTERTRPLAIGAEGLSRSKPEYTSYTTHFPMLHLHDSTLAATTIIRHHQSNHHQHEQLQQQQQPEKSCPAPSQTRRHTIISTTLTNYNQQLAAAFPDATRRSSIGWDTTTTTPTPHGNASKPVRITLIGEALPLQSKSSTGSLCSSSSSSSSSTSSTSLLAQNANVVKMRYPNGCQSVKNGSSAHYQPLYNSNKMTSPTVTIV
ncbi:serine-rich adhesin for platelets isoform X3 [Drosophila simulans]|uniref:serine-rich adhesin for platelets isoform X3 n=1 Tax=Drosophila simulans TaxID=7240 RepID=UPI00192D199A|nr:serine-rich adhesin for platelets isoform X3 [Drosophila simulans]XP_044778922.1 serine-rich adhesin for platelets isoform X3 [Drosophila simulans]